MRARSEESGSGCQMFNELFAAVAILVSIVYYAVVKVTLMAMGAVIMSPPHPHPIYAKDDDCEAATTSPDEEQEDEDAKSTGTFSISSDENKEGVELQEVTVQKKSEHCFPASDEIQEVEEEGEKREGEERKSRQKRKDGMRKSLSPPPERQQQTKSTGERFSSLKIWTNVYGLSIGIYCLVYSLLLPNELSAFVFCLASLAAGVHEAMTPCLQQELLGGSGEDEEDEEYEMLGGGRRCKKKRRRNQQRWDAFKRQVRERGRECVSAGYKLTVVFHCKCRSSGVSGGYAFCRAQ